MINKAAPSTDLPFSSDRVSAGPAFLRAVGDHTLQLLTQAAAKGELPTADVSRIAVLDIPRGGLATSGATADFLSGYYPQADVRRFASNIKHANVMPHQLLPQDLVQFRPDLLVIADGVIASGKSIGDHLTSLHLNTPHNQPAIMVVANVVAEQGRKALENFAEGLRMRDKFSIVAGLELPEDQSTWMTFEGGKQVLFVGYNPETNLDLKIPDFGDYTVPAPAAAL